MDDARYTAAWVVLFLAICGVEYEALRCRPNERATLSAHVWVLLGKRYRTRWILGLACYTAVGAHFFYRRGLGLQTIIKAREVVRPKS